VPEFTILCALERSGPLIVVKRALKGPDSDAEVTVPEDIKKKGNSPLFEVKFRLVPAGVSLRGSTARIYEYRLPGSRLQSHIKLRRINTFRRATGSRTPVP